MSEALGAVPLAGESPKEKKTCAYCERSVTVSPKFIQIDADRRVGDVPLVLTRVIHPESQVVCLQHWLENKQLYEVCTRHTAARPSHAGTHTPLCCNKQKQSGRDSFDGNPASTDALVAMSKRVCSPQSSTNNAQKTKRRHGTDAGTRNQPRARHK